MILLNILATKVKSTDHARQRIYEKNIEKMSIDDKIEYWHTHETGNSLREFLGMTEQEYFDFCTNGIKIKTEK